MLQDVEAGRSLETEALIGSILEMARLTNTPAPSIEAVYALVKLLNKVMLLEGGGVKVEKVARRLERCHQVARSRATSASPKA